MPDLPRRTLAIAALLLATAAAPARAAPAAPAALAVPIAAAPDSAWLRLTFGPERLTGLARFWYRTGAEPAEARLLLGTAYAVGAVTVDGAPADWSETAVDADSSGRAPAPATWRAARALRIALPAAATPRPTARLVEIAYAGARRPSPPWAFRLRSGDLFHPLDPGAPIAWRLELPGVDAATVAGNVVPAGAELRTPRPVTALYLLGAAAPLPWRAVAGTRLACLASDGAPAPAAVRDRLERLLAGAAADWGPYPWPALAIVPDTTRGDRPRAYPGVIETGSAAGDPADDAALLHELLHGWFGLGVTAPPRGDWSEGLCALLADHDLRAAASPAAAAAFRRGLLRRFTALAGTPGDIPLSDYAPGDTVTDIVGYGKGLFFFLELRRELGGPRFAAGLRRLLSRHAGGAADWSDLFRCFAAAAPGDLAPFFTARLDRPGAPRLSAGEATWDRSRREVRLTVSQRAAGEPWPLQLRLRLEGLSGATVWIALDRRERTCRLPAALPPAAVTVDPFWETFRLLGDPDPPRTELGGRPGR